MNTRHMKTVLAVVDDSATASLVLDAAKAMAQTIGGTARAIHVREGAAVAAEDAARAAGVPLDVVEGDVVDGVLAAGRHPDVAVVVVGARAGDGDKPPAGHVAIAAVTKLARPVLVVPPGTHLPGSGRFERILVPLEGTVSSSESVAAAVGDLVIAGAHIAVVHVFHTANAPRFWDQHVHAAEAWGAEFIRRWFAHPDVEIRLRRGEVGPVLVEAVAAERADLIALGWSQDLRLGRAKVVRAVIADSPVPVLLAPVSTDPRGAATDR